MTAIDEEKIGAAISELVAEGLKSDNLSVRRNAQIVQKFIEEQIEEQEGLE